MVGTSPGEILAPVFTGAGDGDAHGCHDLSWKRRRGVALSPHGLGIEGKPQIRWIGRWRRLRVFLLLGGIFSEPATTGRMEDDGIFAVDGGILAAWFAEARRWFLFGNDDGIERMLGRGMVFGSRFFPGALFSTIGANPAYFPCVARRQSQSCRLLARVAIRWHVPSWLLFHVGGQVGW